MEQDAHPFAEEFGKALGNLMGEIDARIAVIISLLFKAGIADRDMIIETLREHAAVHEGYVRERLEEMLRIWEQRSTKLTVIEGGLNPPEGDD